VEKTLKDLSKAEWEALCDGCGRCCLNKFEDEKGRVHYTFVACELLDLKSCQCSDYENRKKRVKDCINIRLRFPEVVKWLPKTCAYRLLHEGKRLKPWHYQNSGNRKSVHEAGISVKGVALSEKKVPHTFDEHPWDYELKGIC